MKRRAANAGQTRKRPGPQKRRRPGPPARPDPPAGAPGATWRQHLTALAIYGAVFAAWGWAVLSDPGRRTFQSFSLDSYANFWNLAWCSEALRHGWNLFETHLLYFPTGSSLALTEFCPLYGVLSAPLLQVWHTPQAAVAAFHGWLAVSFVLTGYCTYLFCRSESGSHPGSLLAGFCVAFSAYRFHHLEHMNLMAMFWLPLTAWLVGTWVMAGRHPAAARAPSRWRLAAIAACGLGLAGTSYTMLAFTALFLVAWWVVVWLFQRQRLLPGRWSRIGAALGALLAGSLPLTWWWLGAFRGGGGAVSPQETIAWSPDLLGFFLPQRSALFGPLFETIGRGLHGSGGLESYLGFALLGLAIVGFRKRGRAGLPLGLTAAVAFLAALGPHGVWVGGARLSLPVAPYDALSAVAPFLEANRTPGRLVVVVLVALAPLAATGLGALLERPRGRLLAAGAVVLALLELVPAWPQTQPVRIHPALARLADAPRPGAVVELPVPLLGLPVAPGEEVLGTWNRYTFDQLAHRRPILGGPLFRPSPAALTYLREHDLPRSLQSPSRMLAALAALREAGFAYVVWNRGSLDAETWRQIQESYARQATPWYADDTLAIYELPAAAPTR